MKKNRIARGLLIVLVAVISGNSSAQPGKNFTWPLGKEAAISLSFDDARYSQVEGGTALLDSMHVKATFYVVTSAVEPGSKVGKKR